MEKRKKILTISLILIFAVVLITIFLAPSKQQLDSGSTYNRQPDGYAAWYEHLSREGIEVGRWQKPAEDLFKKYQNSTTLLRIYPELRWHNSSSREQDWLKRGNKLVIVGVRQLPTAAKFTTVHPTDLGTVKIDTKRRARETKTQSNILSDRYGAIIWQESIGKGKIVKIATPYLAANAYQDYPANYELLTQLITNDSQHIFVDEYLHGYKDREVIEGEIGSNVFSYFLQTPLTAVAVQGTVIFLIALWGLNRRLGRAIPVAAPQENNSKAYIQALGAVLEKAGTSDFLTEVIDREERLKLQQELGLGSRLLDSETLLNIWQNQNRNTEQLSYLLKINSTTSPLKENELLNWLRGWQKINNSGSLNRLFRGKK